MKQDETEKSRACGSGQDVLVIVRQEDDVGPEPSSKRQFTMMNVAVLVRMSRVSNQSMQIARLNHGLLHYMLVRLNLPVLLVKRTEPACNGHRLHGMHGGKPCQQHETDLVFVLKLAERHHNGQY